MQLRLDQLPAHLAKGNLAPLYLIHGEEMLLQIEAADAIRAAALKGGYSEREVWTVEQHFKWDDAIATQDNLSLFASKKITEIRVPTGRLGVEGDARMATIARNASPDDIVVATFPKLDKKQQSSAWFETWRETAVVIETRPIDREQLGAWLGERLRRQDQTAEPEALEYLVEHCEGNLVAAMQEVRKLALVCPKPVLNRDDVEDAVTDVARYTIAQLSEAFLQGDLARFSAVLGGLRAEGEALPRIIWQLSDDVHAVARALTHYRGGQIPAAQAVKSARVWGKRLAHVVRALQQINPRTIAPLVHDLSELDAASKGLRPHVDVWAGLIKLAHKVDGRSIKND